MKAIIFTLWIFNSLPAGTLPPALQQVDNILLPSIIQKSSKIKPLQSIYESPFPLTGTARCVVLLSEAAGDKLQSVPNCGDTPECQRAYYNEMFFRDNPYKASLYLAGSMREFYREASCGKFDFTGDVYGPYTLDNNVLYYSCGIGNDNSGCGSWDSYDACLNTRFSNSKVGCHEYIKDLITKADNEVDFSKYDQNNDGEVDCLIVVHPGEGAEQTCNTSLECDPTKIWTHFWWLKSPKYTNDGQTFIYRYLIGPDWSLASNGKIEMGVFAHEFGHYMGLVDLYDRDFSSCGLGPYSLMAYGTHGYNPNHLDPLSLDSLGWAQRTDVSEDSCEFSLNPVEETCEVLNIGWDGPGDNEFFLVEYRKPEGFDVDLPAESSAGFKGGILIYHVDLDIESKYCGVNQNIDNRCNPSNNCPMREECEWCPGWDPTYHYLIDLEEPACGCDLETPSDISVCDSLSSEDHFFTPEDVVNIFDEKSCPSSRDYNDETGEGPYVLIRDVESDKALLSILLKGTNPSPPEFKTSNKDEEVMAGELYTFTPEVTGTPPITFSLIDSPSGATIDTYTGKITWPAPATVTSKEKFRFVIKAENCIGSSILDLSVNVININVQSNNIKNSDRCLLETLFENNNEYLYKFRKIKSFILAKGGLPGKIFVKLYYSFFSPFLKKLLILLPSLEKPLSSTFKILATSVITK